MTAAETRINDLFEELVPAEGKADTVAGEIIRAVSRIGYRNYNDGDHVGVGYGKETCNPAARFLMARAGNEVKRAVEDMWGVRDSRRYKAAVTTLEEAVLAYLDEHPELKETPNTEDMWDFIDRLEDRDDSEDDDAEEEWW